MAVMLLLSLVVVASPIGAADPTTYHVYSVSELYDAISDASDGDTVYVHAGTYLLTSAIEIDKGISLIGDGESRTFLDGGKVYRVIYTSCPYSTSLISGFTIKNGKHDYGGGMYNDTNSYVTVTNCTFTGNSALHNGGGMYNDTNSYVTVTNCTFTGNSAQHGGGMYNHYDTSNSSQKVTNCIVTNCILFDNRASISGGGIYNIDSSVTITSCTLSGNTAIQRGSGICHFREELNVTNCIIYGNTIETNSKNSNATTYKLYDLDIDTSTPISTCIQYSDIGSGYTSGTCNICADPLFENAAAGNFRLRQESPCIDSGTNTSAEVYGCVKDDITGTPRPQMSGYDMGAYEYVPPIWSPATIQPLVTTALGQANTLWNSIASDLAGCGDECILDMAVQVQERMANAVTIANPVAACGALFQAIDIMGDMAELLPADVPESIEVPE